MAEIVLHHYPLSFFAEKIRRILAFKRLSWRSVEQPIMMPKPELTPLTGGYRKIPVLQIGADVYCDTACIARRLERLAPEPPCIPPASAGTIGLVEEWADHRFAGQVAPSVIVELLPSLPPDVLVDRAAMSPMLSKEAIVGGAPHALSQALLSLDLLERMLDNRPFLTGDAFTLADAACFHPIWFLARSARLFEAVVARPALARWYDRIAAFEPPAVRPMTGGEALAIARESEPADVDGGAPAAMAGVAVGDQVAIVADDYGREESCGTVVRLTPDEITIVHRHAALREIAVHFPRSGYRIVKR